MKLLLITFVVCLAAALAAPADKQKREILPGDPRYGTDYHHHHHHHEHDNDVQISKAAGGYDSIKPSSGFAGFSSGLSSGFSSGFDSQTVDKPITTCATCSINSTHIINKHKEHVQPTDANGVQHLSVSSLPSYTSSISSFPSYFYSSYPSYPSYPSYSNIPVKTVDHHVHVQVPQPYPVPVTKHIAYPVPVPHAVEVPKPYYVRVAQPVQVTVNRPYAVEVPRPVPYPVPQYVRTNIPVVQQQHIATLDATKVNPFEGFIENAQSTFQNVIGNLPSLQNPFENPFQNFELPNLPSLPSFSSQVTQTPAPATVNNVPTATSADSVAIDNPVLKKTAQSVVTHHHQTQSAYKPATTCAGCSVSSTHITSKDVAESAFNPHKGDNFIT